MVRSLVENKNHRPEESDEKRVEASAADSIVLEGVIEKVAFHNTENGFSVFKVNRIDHNELVTVVGFSSEAAVGSTITAHGEWVQNKNYGEQFAAQVIHIIPPNSVDEIEKYLSSGVIKGIGVQLAKKLVLAFGDKVLDVIEHTPQKLLTVENVGAHRLQMIKESWQENRSIRKIMVFLQTHGISPSKAIKIYQKYGEDAVDVVRQDPYRLAKDIPGIGFQTADQIAIRLGVDTQSQIRAKAGLIYALSEKSKNGHCAYPQDKLLNDSKIILNGDEKIIAEALDQEISAGFLTKDTIEGYECIFLTSLYRVEKSVAETIVSLQVGVPPWPHPKSLDKDLRKTEKKLKLSLAPLQKLAIQTALINKICVITGGPGTGKSTLTLALTNYLKNLDIRITLCSPTGRAAKRLSECTGLEAKTIHRTLMYDPDLGDFKYNSFKPLETDFVLIDEASMLDIYLAQSLFRAIPSHAVVVIVGDVDQLPSVGPGQFLKDLIDSGLVPVVTLSQIFRQAKESHIIQAAHQVNHGILPDLTPHRQSDFFFLERNTPESVAATILELMHHRLPSAYGYDPIHDIQVLCPMIKGEAGVKNLNNKIQQLINAHPIALIEKSGLRYGVGDKVMITENDYDKDIFNGDMGLIERVNTEEQTLTIVIDKRLVEFKFSELQTVQPSYAITIHKSQGSEYPVVIIPVVLEHAILLQKNLIYTAMTRGKKLVVMVGQVKALSMAVHDLKKRKRWTKLKERLIPV